MNQRGSAIIMIIASLGIVGGISYYLMGQNENAGQRAKTLNLHRDANDLSAQIMRMLGDRAACRHSFLGLNAAGSTVSAIKNSAGVTVFDANTVFGRSGLKIHEMRLEDLPGTQDGVATLPNGESTTNLVIKYKLMPRTAYESRHLQRKVKFTVIQNASAITDCHAISAVDDSIWSRVSGTEGIHYPDGYVGIGLDQPQQRLDVAGRIRVQNESGEDMGLGGASGEYGLELGADFPVQVRVDAGTGGDLRGGVVESTERVQLSGAPSTCNAKTEQSIRYHANSRTFQVCLSGYWRTIKASKYPTLP